jgi:integrase/recombinase XerD
MVRYRPPMTTCLPFEEWPALHQEAWRQANREGDILTGRGPAAHWKPKSRYSIQKAYGNYLRYLRDQGHLQEELPVEQILAEVLLRDYIAVLRQRTAPVTVVTQVALLSSAIAAMAPEADRTLLKLAINRLKPIARRVRNKDGQLVSPVILLQLGQTLMANWPVRRAHDPRLSAMDYRDGLMIAFLALCPVRLENLAQMLIGQHLSFQGDLVRVVFAGHETKGGRPLEFDWPQELRPALEFYLSRVHPMLYDEPQAGAPLWPNLQRRKRQMGECGIYMRITKVTMKHLGRRINPHMFRDAAATFISEMTPDRALLAAGVLQHSNLQVTRDHYVRGQQHQMLHRYHGAIDAMIADVTAEPLGLNKE